MRNVITNYVDNELVPIINGLAKKKIEAFFPAWKQSNANFDMALMAHKKTLSIEEKIRVKEAKALWERVEAIRDASNKHIAALQALSEMPSMEPLQSYDYVSGWPE